MAISRSDYHLPEEIIFQILLLLPVKSLIRFRSVCKPWSSIISDPQFMETHLTESKEKHPSLLGASSSAFDNRTAYIIDLNSFQDSVTLQLPFPFIPMEFVSSCNGIVCACKLDASSIYLCCPLTGQYKILPVFKNKTFLGPGVGLAFGYDSVSSDYKVLRILCYLPSIAVYEDKVFDKVEVELYSANADSWTEIPVSQSLQSLLYYCKDRVACGVVVKGVVYFKCKDKLVSFDFHTEVFELVWLPSSKCKEAKYWKVLEFEGAVALIFISAIDDSYYEEISLWTLDVDVSGIVSWTEKLSFYNDINLDWVSCISIGGGQIVAKEEGEQQLILYDCVNKEISEKFKLPPYVRVLLSYTESLVSIDGFKYSSKEVTFTCSNLIH